MAIKVITVKSSEIKEHPYNRFDYGFYFVKRTFEELKQKGLSINNIDELTDYVISGSYVKTYLKENDKDAIPYIRVATIKHYFLNENRTDFAFVSKNVPKKIKTQEKDIVIGRTAVLGIASIIDKANENIAISQHITRIRFNKNKISNEFALAFMNSNLFKMQMAIASYGTTRTELTHQQLKSVKFVLPDKDFENKIIKLVNVAILKNRKSLKLLNQARELFYQKLDIDFSKIKKEKFYSVNLSDIKKSDLWIPKYYYPFYVKALKTIQEKWQTISLDKIATVKRGDEVGSKNYNKYLDRKDTDVPFIRTSDLINYEIDQFPDFYIPKEIYEELNQDIKTGDVLFNNDGKIGLVAMLTSQDKVILQSHIRRLRAKKEAIEKYNLTQEYLFLVLSIKEIAKYQANRYTVIQSTIPTISKHLLDFEIPILDKNSIEEITKLIKQAFELKNEKKKIIKKVREEIDNYFNL